MRVNHAGLKNPGLSVCMIVKDEERQIVEAVENFQKFADEVILVDTHDNTTNLVFSNNYRMDNIDYDRLILKTYQSNKFDFSTARNESLSYANYNWIIWLDADDRIDEENCNRLKVFSSANIKPTKAFQLKITNTIDGLPIGASFLQTRLIPNIGLEFTGLVHETLSKSITEKGLTVNALDIQIQHTGYESEEVRVKKCERNLELLLKIKEPNYLNFLEIGDCKFGLKQFHPAYMAYDKSLQRYLNDNSKCLIQTKLGVCMLEMKNYTSAVSHFLRGIKYNQDIIDNWFYAGKAFELKGDYEEAIRSYKSALECPEIVSNQGSNYHQSRILTYYRLARIYNVMGQHRKALDLYNQLSTQYPNVTDD